MKETIGSRFKRAWNIFMNRDPTYWNSANTYGQSSGYRPDRTRMTKGRERSIITAICNRIALDASSINLVHARVDENGHFLEYIDDTLHQCLTVEANLDQTGRAFRQDIFMSMLDEGCVAVVPVEADFDPDENGSYKIDSLRCGKILEWMPQHVRVRLYNELTGQFQEVVVPKKYTAIIENPWFSVMNEPNSTMQRLIRKLGILDVIDEQSGSGKLDLIIQLPYVIKSQARRDQAEQRRRDIEQQLSGSKYGIAYTDGTEHMYKCTKKYIDFNGVEREEDFYFNFTKAELAEWELGVTGGLSAMVEKISAAKDVPALATLFKDLLLKAYGIKSADGRRFMKSKEISTEFEQTQAYSDLYMELATNDEAAINFINQIIPQVD